MVECINRAPRVAVEARRLESLLVPLVPLVFGRCKRAKRLFASSSGVSGSFDEVDDRIAQPWLASHASPLEFDTSSLQVSGRFRWRKTVFRLVGCQSIVGGMGLETVMPIPESVEPCLHGVGHRQQRCSSSPRLDVPIDPLDLRVEMPGMDLTSDVCEPAALNRGAEPLAELASVICHEVSGTMSRFIGRVLHKLREISRTWPVPEGLQGDDLEREAIDNRSDFDVLPEHAERRDIEMPDLMRRGGVLCMGRGFRSSVARCVSTRASRHLCMQHAPNRGPTDSDAGSHDVAGDCSHSEVGLGKGPSQFVDQPTHAFVKPSPRRVSEHPLRA